MPPQSIELNLVQIIETVKNIWQRFDERYGNPSLLVDVIMNEVRNIGVLVDGDSVQFIDFVNKIEKGYTDLQRLGLENEISNSVTVNFLLNLMSYVSDQK